MIKTFSIFAFVIFGFTSLESKFNLLKSIPTKSLGFTTDNLENSYLFNKNILEKYNSEGTFQKSFSNKNLGAISFVDAQDPLKILLFYKTFQQIVFVDNMLAQYGNAISLDALGYNQVNLACTSHNNGFWIYNQQNFEMVRFDQNLKINQQTGNISQISGRQINPNFIIEQNNNVFLNDSSTGILVFDIYGTYNKTIPIKGLLHFQVNNEQIIYQSELKLKSYNIKTLQETEILLPSAEVLGVRTEKEKLYLLKQKSLDIYSVIK
jgi:hypothetical protein